MTLTANYHKKLLTNMCRYGPKLNDHNKCLYPQTITDYKI